jgi:hypothetical protein
VVAPVISPTNGHRALFRFVGTPAADGFVLVGFRTGAI